MRDTIFYIIHLATLLSAGLPDGAIFRQSGGMKLNYATKILPLAIGDLSGVLSKFCGGFMAI